MEALTRALNNHYWHAVFDVHLTDDGRKAGDYTIKAWAKNLDAAFVRQMKYFHETPDLHARRK